MTASTSGMQAKSISSAQLAMIRQANLKQQLRLHASTLAAQGVKSSTVTIGGQQAVLQFTQAQPRAQFLRQGEYFDKRLCGCSEVNKTLFTWCRCVTLKNQNNSYLNEQ